jgi:hypothetical protein
MKIYVEGHFNSNMRTLMLVSKWDGIPYCELKGGRGGGRVSLNRGKKSSLSLTCSISDLIQTSAYKFTLRNNPFKTLICIYIEFSLMSNRYNKYFIITLYIHKNLKLF